MIAVACSACHTSYMVSGDVQEAASLLGDTETFKCVTPLCRGRMRLTHSWAVPAKFEVVEMPLRDFFRAIHGFGSGTGAPASLNRAREILLTKRIVDLVAESVGQPERVILKELVLEDGTRLHFDSSSRGACLFYIEEQDPSCVETLDGELHTGGATSVGDSDREEARRDLEAAAGNSELRIEAGVATGDGVPTESTVSGGVPSVPEAGELSAQELR